MGEARLFVSTFNLSDIDSGRTIGPLVAGHVCHDNAVSFPPRRTKCNRTKNDTWEFETQSPAAVVGDPFIDTQRPASPVSDTTEEPRQEALGSPALAASLPH